MKVLSLFDGISCGMVALERAGIPVDRYVAYEIEPNAIKISQKNYPMIEHCGDVTIADFTQYRGFDAVIAGTPCQSVSITTGKKRTHLKGKSRLFWEFVRALEEVKPKWFLLENVASMNEESKQIISEAVGCQPIFIDSEDFSAQSRERIYWTNILKRVNSPLFKCHTLTCVSGGNQQKKVLDNGRPRKLTPLEYERLQTLPDGYTEGVSDTARYSAIGNGWTVDVIAHIFTGLKECECK